jgi:hypothetical protein
LFARISRQVELQSTLVFYKRLFARSRIIAGDRTFGNTPVPCIVSWSIEDKQFVASASARKRCANSKPSAVASRSLAGEPASMNRNRRSAVW